MSASRLRIPFTDLAGAAALAAITAALYFAVVRPIGAQRESIHAKRSELAMLRDEMDQLNMRRLRGQERLAAQRRELETMPVRLEPVDRLNGTIARVVELASACGLQIHESRSGEVVRGERHDTVPIGLSGRGRFPACVAFLHRGASALPDVDLLRFELTGNPATATTAAAAATGAAFEFELEWYAASAETQDAR